MSAGSPAIESCLYSGTIEHRRRAPAGGFHHALSLAYLDLDELPDLLGGRLLRRGPGPLRFRRDDYLGGSDGTASDLAEVARDRVAALTGTRPSGPVRLLTQLRSFGVCFNPVSFYYCFENDPRRPSHVLAEVTNTPWGERHSYVLSRASGDGAVLNGEFAKALHVSPFFGMDHRYRASASTPGRTLAVHIANQHAGETVFEATLKLARRELTPRSATIHALRHPADSARVLALIYGHAFGLKLRGARYFPHPAAAAR